MNSTSLIASGEDARFDGIISFSVFASAIIFILTKISLEAYVGVVISIMIIKSGFGMMKESIDDIVGHRPEAEVTRKIKRLISEEKDVRGAYDVIIYDFGPDKLYASCHMEVPDTLSAAEIDRLTRKIEQKVYKEMGVALTAIGIYSYNTSHDEAATMRDKIIKTVIQNDHVLQVHGFYVDFEEKRIRFDAVMSFDVDGREAAAKIKNEVEEMYKGFTVDVTADKDLSD